MDDAKALFGKRLRFLRKERGLTLEDLGQAASIGYKHVADVERGEKAPSFEAVEKLAKALGVPVYKMFLPADGSDEPLTVAQLAREIDRRASPQVKELARELLSRLASLDGGAGNS